MGKSSKKMRNFQATCKKMTPGGYLAIQDMDLIKSRNGISLRKNIYFWQYMTYGNKVEEK